MVSERNILVVLHTGRPDSVDAAVRVCAQLREAGATAVISPQESDDVGAYPVELAGMPVLGVDVDMSELELVIVLGGDGTILRAAELVRGSAVPLLGSTSAMSVSWRRASGKTSRRPCGVPSLGITTSRSA